MLRYVDTDEPGLRRGRCSGGFVYIAADGSTPRARLSGAETLCARLLADDVDLREAS